MDVDCVLNALRSKAAAVPPEVLLQRMGYRKVLPAAQERLSRVLADPDLGLKQGGFDFGYDSKGFIAALCLAVGILDDDAHAVITAITTRLAEDAAAFKPYLFVDTEFRRRNEPVFTMAIMEGQRYVSVPESFRRLPLEQQLARASERVRQHMADTAGKLPLWGDIKRYFYYFDEGRAMEIALDGRVVEERQPAILYEAFLERGVEHLLMR